MASICQDYANAASIIWDVISERDYDSQQVRHIHYHSLCGCYFATDPEKYMFSVSLIVMDTVGGTTSVERAS